jgi:L-iditol 2-dehydrogenase
MGHEAAGTLFKIGPRVKGWKVGQRVTFDSTVYCGKCDNCRKGQTNLCKDRQVLGVSCKEYRRNGAMAEYLAVPARILYELPKALSFDEAALAEPLSVAVHAVSKLNVEKGGVGVVVGVGIIGLLALQVLKHYGCSKLAAVDMNAERLKVAKSLGADLALNPASDDVPAAIRAFTNGKGADYAAEAVGVSKSIGTAISALRTGGKVVLIGNISPIAEIPLQVVVTNEIQVIGTCASSGEYKECLRLMGDGSVNVRTLISATPYFADGELWMKKLHNAEDNLLKIVLHTKKSQEAFE